MHPPLPRLRRLLAALLLAGLAAPAAAQISSDGSIYSSFGVGELQSHASSRAFAMGGAGTALSSFNYLSLSNPATWSSQILTRFSGSFLYQSHQIVDAADNRSRINSGALGTVQVGLPVSQNRIGIVLAFEPVSRVGYRVVETGSLEPAPGEPAADYEVSHEGHGGLQQVVAGAGWRFAQRASIGASANLVFGMLENARRATFLDPDLGTRHPEFDESRVATSTRLSGLTFNVGGLVSFPALLSSGDFLNIGASVTLPTSLRGVRVRTLGQEQDADTLGAQARGNVRLPVRLTTGLSYAPDARWTIALDARYEPWSRFESDFSFGGYEPEAGRRLDDRLRVGGGIEYLPAGRDVSRGYFAQAAYRAGFYADQAYFSPAQVTNLTTYAVTGGISFPTLVPGTRLDLGFEVGSLGTTEDSLVRDLFYRVSATVNIGERWFVKRRLD